MKMVHFRKYFNRVKRNIRSAAGFVALFCMVFFLFVILQVRGTWPLTAGFGNYNDYSYDSGSSYGGGSSWGGSDRGGSSYDYGSSYGGSSRSRSKSYRNPQWGDGQIHSISNIALYGDLGKNIGNRRYYTYTVSGQMEMGTYEELAEKIKNNPERYSRTAYEAKRQQELMNENGWVFVLVAISFGVSIFKMVYAIGNDAAQTPATTRTTTSGNGAGAPAYVTQHDKGFDARVFKNRSAEIEALINEHDPRFGMSEFLAYARNVYMEIQTAWSKRDLKSVYHLLDENLYDQSEKQVQQFIDDKIINALKSISILSAYATSYKTDAKNEIITVYLCAKMRDYQYEEETNRIVRGNMTTFWELSYRMRFVRLKGSKTKQDGEIRAYHCPNCASPLKVGVSEKCPHCGSFVSSIKSEWLLHDFEGVNSSMQDEGMPA